MTIFYPRRQRVAIIGLPGAGKTTLAHRYAEVSGLPHIELDALYWEANWTRIDPDCFRQCTTQALKPERWLVEGNQVAIYDLIFARAEMLVWLDPPLPIMMQRLLARTLKNLFSNATLWSGNKEEWRRHFLTRESIFLKLAKSYTSRRQMILTQLKQPQYRQLELIHLRSPQAVQSWVEKQFKANDRDELYYGRTYFLFVGAK
jgi:adenylate kinase family enzyme